MAIRMVSAAAKKGTRRRAASMFPPPRAELLTDDERGRESFGPPEETSMFPAPNSKNELANFEERLPHFATDREKDQKALQRLLTASIEAGNNALSDMKARMERSLAIMAGLKADVPTDGSLDAAKELVSQGRAVEEQYSLGLRTAVEEQQKQILILLKLVFEGKDVLEQRENLQRATDAESKAAISEAKVEELKKSAVSDSALGQAQSKDELHAALEKENAKLRSALRDKDAGIAHAQEETASKDAQVAKFQAQVVEIQAGHQSLISRVLQRANDAESKSARLLTDVEDGKAKLRGLNSEIAQLRGALEAKRQQISELQAAVEIKDKQLAKQQARDMTSDMETEAKMAELMGEAAQAQVASLRVQALEVNCLQLDTHISQLEAAIHGKDTIIASLQAKTTELEAQLTQELRRAASERDQLEAQLRVASATRSDLQAVELRDALARCEQEVEQLRSIGLKQDAMEELRSGHARQEQQLQQLRAAEISAERRAGELQAAAAEHAQQVIRLQGAKAGAEHRVAALQARLEADEAMQQAFIRETLAADKRIGELEGAEHVLQARVESAEARAEQMALAREGEKRTLTCVSEELDSEYAALQCRAREADEEMRLLSKGEARLAKAAHEHEDEMRRAANAATLREERALEQAAVLQAEVAAWMPGFGAQSQGASTGQSYQEERAAAEEMRAQALEEERDLLHQQLVGQRAAFEDALLALQGRISQYEENLSLAEVSAASEAHGKVAQFQNDLRAMRQLLQPSLRDGSPGRQLLQQNSNAAPVSSPMQGETVSRWLSQTPAKAERSWTNFEGTVQQGAFSTPECGTDSRRSDMSFGSTSVQSAGVPSLGGPGPQRQQRHGNRSVEVPVTPVPRGTVNRMISVPPPQKQCGTVSRALSLPPPQAEVLTEPPTPNTSVRAPASLPVEVAVVGTPPRSRLHSADSPRARREQNQGARGSYSCCVPPASSNKAGPSSGMRSSERHYAPSVVSMQGRVGSVCLPPAASMQGEPGSRCAPSAAQMQCNFNGQVYSSDGQRVLPVAQGGSGSYCAPTTSSNQGGAGTLYAPVAMMAQGGPGNQMCSAPRAQTQYQTLPAGSPQQYRRSTLGSPATSTQDSNVDIKRRLSEASRSHFSGNSMQTTGTSAPSNARPGFASPMSPVMTHWPITTATGASYALARGPDTGSPPAGSPTRATERSVAAPATSVPQGGISGGGNAKVRSPAPPARLPAHGGRSYVGGTGVGLPGFGAGG